MKILILGIGNILFGDEGVGSHFVHYLDEKYCFDGQNEIHLVDGGTLAHQLIPLIVSYDQVILVDCIENEGGSFGDVFFFDFAEMPCSVNWQGSAHEVETLQTLEMMRTHGDIPPIKILGVIPVRIDTDPTFSLSTEMIGAIEIMERVLLKYLVEIDPKCKIEKNNAIKIENITPITFKHRIKQNDF